MIFLGFDIRGAGYRAPVLKIERRYQAPLSPVPSPRGGWQVLVREPFTGAWQRNQEWRTDTVTAHHAVYGCVSRISQDVGKLRPKLMEQDRDTGIWSEVQSAAFSPVLNQPNRFQNYIQFKEWWVTCKLLHGNAYALKRRDGRGVVVAMYLLDPCRVSVLVAEDGEVFYQLKRDDLSEQPGEPVTVPASEIVHDRINCLFHPLVGVSPIYACGQAANMGLQIEKNSSGFFQGGSNPSGILSSPAVITPAKSKELSEIWETQYGGSNSGRVAVLGDSMKFEPMRMSAVDSQLIEQLRWTAETVCSAFHVPPFKLGIGAMPAYTNPEIANQLYYSDCLQSHIESWELCMDEGLGLRTPTSDNRRLGVELDLDGLLRMDSATQMKSLAEGVGGGILTPNDARQKVDKKPLPGGDTVYLQQQQYSIAALAERDSDKPFSKPIAPTPPPAADAAPDSGASDRGSALAARIRLRSRIMRIAA